MINLKIKLAQLLAQFGARFYVLFAFSLLIPFFSLSFCLIFACFLTFYLLVRLNGIQEASGSNPLSSTKKP